MVEKKFVKKFVEKFVVMNEIVLRTKTRFQFYPS